MSGGSFWRTSPRTGYIKFGCGLFNVVHVNNGGRRSCLDPSELFNQDHTHNFTIPCDTLLARHSSTCLSVGPSSAAAAGVSSLIERFVENYRVKTVSKHLGGAGVGPAAPTVCFKLHCFLSTSSMWADRGKKDSLFSNFDNNGMEDTCGANPIEESTSSDSCALAEPLFIF